MRQHIRFSVHKFRGAIGVCFFALMMAIYPLRSFAQCEGPIADALLQPLIAQQDIALQTMTTNIQNGWMMSLNNLRMQLGTQDQTDWKTLFNGMNMWWTLWGGGLKNLGRQLSADIIDETAKLGLIDDANDALAAAQDEQKERIKSELSHQPTDQACRFDTNANYLAQDRAIDEALQNGFEWDFVSLANNEYGSLAQYGPGDLQRQRWNIYTQNFCDYKAEDCDSGCSPPGGSALQTCPASGKKVTIPNYDIYVSNMLFRDQTIVADTPDVSSSTTLQGMQSMMFNVTGFKVPDPIVSGAFGTEPGEAQMFERREYMARMAAVGSLLYSVVGDRIQGVASPEPQAMRVSVGMTGTNGTLSVRELRQSIIEQLWDPNFYKNLGDNPVAVSQKELYLKAYSLSMLYDMIAKQEKISMAYAIETAGMLEDTSGERASTSGPTPVQQGK
jgi:hypothetical protein